jgi:hypothetical protein
MGYKFILAQGQYSSSFDIPYGAIDSDAYIFLKDKVPNTGWVVLGSN